MKDTTAKVVVENGGGNHELVWSAVDSLWGLSRLRNEGNTWEALREIDCDNFYMKDGSKVTRSLKAWLEDAVGKDLVKKCFAEFCKRVGDFYTEVTIEATLRNKYFITDEVGEWGDSGSCFGPGGCNRQHGKFIDFSPCTGVLTLKPEDKFGFGRIIVWFKDSTTAHLINRYTEDDKRELPHNIFVRALEALTKTKLTYIRKSTQTLPVYLNNYPLICTAVDGTNFDKIVNKNYRFGCTECGEHYSSLGSALLCPDCDRPEFVCCNCQEHVSEDEYSLYRDDIYCSSCYEDHVLYCGYCEEDRDRNEAVRTIDSLGRYAGYVCGDCAQNHFSECRRCWNTQNNEYIVETTDTAHTYCNQCAENYVYFCTGCDLVTDIKEFDDEGYCSDCHREEDDEEGAA
jgi:hypothetical protein